MRASGGITDEARRGREGVVEDSALGFVPRETEPNQPANLSLVYSLSLSLSLSLFLCVSSLSSLSISRRISLFTIRSFFLSLTRR